jgi:predicted SnoaL-like aldol condensation-catalyzing enzyme
VSSEEVARNKAVVEAFVAEVAIGKNLDRLDDLVAEDYIQHNPHAGQGREGVREFFAVFHQGALDEGLHPRGTIAVNLIGEGEFVVRQEIRDNGVLIDIWRVRDGMLREHWDSWRPAPGHDVLPGFHADEGNGNG